MNLNFAYPFMLLMIDMAIWFWALSSFDSIATAC
jgi:hypothetical protein